MEVLRILFSSEGSFLHMPVFRGAGVFWVQMAKEMDLLADCKQNLLIAVNSNILHEGNTEWAIGFKHVTSLYKILQSVV